MNCVSRSLSIKTAWLILTLISTTTSTAEEVVSHEITVEEFLIANTLWTLLHETAHAMIEELDIPVFGHEEDAADQFATIALLHGATDMGVAKSTISEVDAVIAAAQAWRIEWELGKRQNVQAAYWDIHALDIQRFYNMMCLLYGSDPDKYEQVEEQLGLPYQRAFACADYEHEQARRAVNRAIEVYADLYGGDYRRGEVEVIYEDPMNDVRFAMAEKVKRSGIAELVAGHTERLVALPNDLSIVFMSCLGNETAFWRKDRREIVMCYDLLERFQYLYQARACFDNPGLTETKLEECLIRKQF